MNIRQRALLYTTLAPLIMSTSLAAQTPAKAAQSVSAQSTGTPKAFTLTSKDVKNGGFGAAQVLNAFGCSGGNVSPQLSWTHAPAGTKSFVLTLFDPDAPTGSGFWHWVVVNIPSSSGDLPSGASKNAAKL